MNGKDYPVWAVVYFLLSGLLLSRARQRPLYFLLSGLLLSRAL